MPDARSHRLAARRFSATFVFVLCNAVGWGVVGRIATCCAAEVADHSREDQLRAGYLLNFAKFVEWPAFPASEPLSVCFLGGAGVRTAFNANASGKSIGGHSLVTRELKNRLDASGCSIIYIDANVPGASDYLVKTVSAAVLTVGDAPDFLSKGGIIEMFTKDNHLRFNISLFNARRASLRMGSDLLQLAVRVEEAER